MQKINETVCRRNSNLNKKCKLKERKLETHLYYKAQIDNILTMTCCAINNDKQN